MAEHEDEGGRDSATTTTHPTRHSRRLSDKILVAFHHACDVSDLEVAEQLLGLLEWMLARRTVPPQANRRRNMESLVAAHERLWHLRRVNTELE